MKWIKCLIILTGIVACASVMPPEQRYTIDLGNPAPIEPELLEEPPMQPEEVITDNPDTWTEHECLARAIYFESKGQGDRGMQLVAQVTMNRVNSNKKYFPNTICQVIRQKTGKSCTYSWYCDGKSDRPREQKEFDKAKLIADNAIQGKYEGMTKALYFKKCNVVSEFFNKLRYLGREKSHCFYTE